MKDDQKLRAAVEIGMLGALVAGRWLLPRGELTRDQLSALLLTFIGNGADCIGKITLISRGFIFAR